MTDEMKTWKGRDIETMNAVELREVVRDLARRLKHEHDSHLRTFQMFRGPNLFADGRYG
jgi:hypothetical protein